MSEGRPKMGRNWGAPRELEKLHAVEMLNTRCHVECHLAIKKLDSRSEGDAIAKACHSKCIESGTRAIVGIGMSIHRSMPKAMSGGDSSVEEIWEDLTQSLDEHRRSLLARLRQRGTRLYEPDQS